VPTEKVGGILRRMQLRLSDLASIPDLRQHFERSGFVTNRLDDETVEIWQPSARSDRASREAIELHLGVWRAMHPEVEIELL
jgi:hypothetical protein